MSTVNLIYVGDDFYHKSGSMISPLYEEDTWARFDWGFVSRELRAGNAVNIRPATSDEMGTVSRMYEASSKR